MLRSMKELPLAERIRRMTKAEVQDSPISSVSDADRGDAVHRACVAACQVVDARPDGHLLRLQQEPPAADYRDIWTRLNREWRNARKG